MHIAAKFQSSLVFDMILQLISTDDIINQAIQLIPEDNNTLFLLAFKHQPLKNVIQLIRAADNTSLDMLFYAECKNRYFGVLLDYLFHDQNYLPPDLLPTIFGHALFAHYFLLEAEKRWLEGESLPTQIIDRIRLLASYPEILPDYPREVFTAMSSYDFFDDKMDYSLEKIWREGVSSWQAFHKLRQEQDKVEGLRYVLDHLLAKKVVLTGSSEPFQLDLSLTPTTQLMNCLRGGFALAKMIAEEKWQSNLSGLLNHQLQTLPETKADTYEYDFELDAVRRFDSTNYRQDEQFPLLTHACLISPGLNSSVHEDSGTGLIFDSRLCQIKTMLMQRGMLQDRQWIGPEAFVNNYAKQVSVSRYPDFDEFCDAVLSCPEEKNEVLVKLSREALLGIIITVDTPKARENARLNQTVIQCVFEKNLPIVFYDSIAKTIDLYNSSQMRDDVLALQQVTPKNLTAEAKAKARTLAIKLEFENASALMKYSFFSGAWKPQHAEKILKLIRDAEQNGDTVWVDILAEVQKLLINTINNPSTSRHPETQLFYEKEFKKYF